MRHHDLRDGDRTLRVSELCLGTMMFGTDVDRETSFAILDRYHDAGGRFLDTANIYAFWADGGRGGESETVLGAWLRDRGVRDEVTLATKLGAGSGDPSRPYGPHNREGLGPEVVRRELAGSLERLGVDHVELLYAHADDRHTPLAETLGALDAEVAAGRVGVLGASNYTTWRLALARDLAAREGLARFAAVQMRHTYLDARPMRDPVTDQLQLGVTPELTDYARAEGDLAILGYSPLLAGAYTRRDRDVPSVYDHPGTPPRLRVVREIADELGVSANQVVLAWMLASDPPVLPVIGVSSVAQLEDCLGAVDVKLDAELLARLDAA